MGVGGGECGEGALIFGIIRRSDDAAFVAAEVAFCVLISSLADMAVEVLEEGLFAEGGRDGCEGGAAEAVGARVHGGGHFGYSCPS